MAPKNPNAKPVDKVKNFKDLASKRTGKVLKDLDILENCGVKTSYTYTPEQAASIITALRAAVDRIELTFKVGSKAPTGGAFSV